MNCQSTSCTILNVPTGSVKLMKFKKVKLSLLENTGLQRLETLRLELVQRGRHSICTVTMLRVRTR